MDTVKRKARHSRYDCNPGCAVEATASLFDGKWKGVILFHLMDGPVRFNQIRRSLPCLTQRMLTNQLREMEADRLIARKVYAQVPPQSEVQPDAARTQLGTYPPGDENFGGKPTWVCLRGPLQRRQLHETWDAKSVPTSHSPCGAKRMARRQGSTPI